MHTWILSCLLVWYKVSHNCLAWAAFLFSKSASLSGVIMTDKYKTTSNQESLVCVFYMSSVDNSLQGGIYLKLKYFWKPKEQKFPFLSPMGCQDKIQLQGGGMQSRLVGICRE